MSTRKNRAYVIIICVAFIAAVLLSALFIAREAGHNCSGDNCPICTCIQQAEHALKNIGAGTKSVLCVLLIPAAVLFATVFAVFLPHAKPSQVKR